MADPKDCSVSRVITAVALQGTAVAPTVSVMPKILALPGDQLPFVPSVRAPRRGLETIEKQRESCDISSIYILCGRNIC